MRDARPGEAVHVGERQGTLVAFGPELCLVQFDDRDDGPYADPEIVQTSQVRRWLDLREIAEPDLEYRRAVEQLRALAEECGRRIEQRQPTPAAELLRDVTNVVRELLPLVQLLLPLVAELPPEQRDRVVAAVRRLREAGGLS